MFWFVILILQQNCQNVIGIESENFEHLDDCISHAVNTLGKLKTTISYTVEKNDLVSEVLKKVYVPVVLNAVENPKKQGLDKRTPNELVLILDDLNVQKMLGDTLWNGNTIFFVVRKNLQNANEDFKSFWKFKIVNVYEVVQNDDGIKVYSFLPYAKESCALEEPLLVDEYLPSAGKFLNNGKAFKDPSRIKNMNGCPVNITVVDVKPNVMFHDECGCNGTTHLQGIEANVINEIAKKLNFNATFVIAKDGIGWGWIRPSPHGVVGEVYTGRSDFGIGLLAPTIERFESLDLSLPYNGEECITYGVPTGAGASTPNWITILFFEFNPAAWILIIISFISIIITFRLVNNFLHMTRLRSAVDIFLFVFSTFLGMSVKIPSYLSFRLPMIFWIVFSFVVTIAYRSSMGSKLTVPNKDPDINTFQELLNSKLELTGYNNMLRLLQYNDKEPVIQAMIDRFKVTDFDIDFAVDYIASGEKIAYVRHTTTFLYYALINPKARGHIHVIKDCIYLFHPLVVAKKYSPFTNRINIIISRLMESGITKRWRADYIYKIPPLTKPFLKLSNDQMYGVFCILGFGYALSLLTFLAEIVYRLYKQDRMAHPAKETALPNLPFDRIVAVLCHAAFGCNSGLKGMSAYKRVQQWATFARIWYIYDAKWQNPFDSAPLIAKYLRGLHKPIYHPQSDCGDHVVVINCKEIALPGNEWKTRVYHHHTGYPGGVSWTLAWEVHKKNSTYIMEKAVKRALPGNLHRKTLMQRLHLYEDANVPENILSNVSNQLRQLRPVPRKLSSFSEKEIEEFPKIEDFKPDYIIR